MEVPAPGRRSVLKLYYDAHTCSLATHIVLDVDVEGTRLPIDPLRQQVRASLSA